MLAAVVGKVELVVKATTQPRLAGHFLERMAPDTEAQTALGAQLFKARQQQDITPGKDVQVQGANKRRQQGDNRAAALSQKQHHQHDRHRHIQEMAAFLLQQHGANKDTDTAITREVDNVSRAGITR